MGEGLERALTAYLDTHVALWLHDGLVELLSAEAKKQIEANDLLLSPMTLLELHYLYKRKRCRAAATAVCDYLATRFGVALCGYPFPAVALEATAIDWTSDPFDRIIVAQAQANGGAMLITADRLIRRNYRRAVW